MAKPSVEDWYHAKEASALLMMTAQRIYHETTEIMLRLDSIGSARKYAEYENTRTKLLEFVSAEIEKLDKVYTLLLSKSVPLINEDNKILGLKTKAT